MLTHFQRRRFKIYRALAVTLGLLVGFFLILGVANKATLNLAGVVLPLLICTWQASRFNKVLQNDVQGIEQDMRWTTRMKILYSIGAVIVLLILWNTLV